MAKNTIPYGYRIVDGKAVVMEDEAERLTSCSKLSPEYRENLRIFLKSAISVS